MLLLSMMMFRWWSLRDWRSPMTTIGSLFFSWLAPANADDSAWGQHLDSIILSGAMCRWIVKINSYLTYLLECQVTLLLHIWHANGSHRQPRMLMATFSIWCLNYSTTVLMAPAAQCVLCAFVDLIFSACLGSKSLITFDYEHQTFFKSNSLSYYFV